MELFANADTAFVSGVLAHIEVSGALVSAARLASVPVGPLLARLDADLGGTLITMVGADACDVEALALQIVRQQGIRALDALHVATAVLTLRELAGPGDETVFISRDTAQAAAAAAAAIGLNVA